MMRQAALRQPPSRHEGRCVPARISSTRRVGSPHSTSGCCEWLERAMSDSFRAAPFDDALTDLMSACLCRRCLSQTETASERVPQSRRDCNLPAAWSQGRLLVCGAPIPADGDDRPDRFDDPEGPGTRKETVSAGQATSECECKDKDLSLIHISE